MMITNGTFSLKILPPFRKDIITCLRHSTLRVQFDLFFFDVIIFWIHKELYQFELFLIDCLNRYNKKLK